METIVEVLEDSRVKVAVTVDAKKVDARIKKTYKDVASKYNFTGFRKGKAPRPVIDNVLGKGAVIATVTDEIVNESTPLAIEECNLYPISKPEFDEDADLVECGKPYTFTFTVNVKPEFDLPSYDPVEIELPAEGASDKEIDKQIEVLRTHYYGFKDAPANTKVKDGSYVDLAIKAFDANGRSLDALNTESRLYSVGSGLFPPEFDEQIKGLKKNQEVAFELDVTTDYPAITSALKGRAARVSFEVKINVLKKKFLPELTDEWVKDSIGFENIEAFRKRVGESIAQQKADILPRLKESACLNKLGERVDGDVPAGMCDENEATLLQEFFRQLQSKNMTFDLYLAEQNITSEQFKEDIKRQAIDMTKQDIALDAWARHFEIGVSEDEIADEFVKSGADNPQELQEDWRVNGQLYIVRQGIVRTKATHDLMEKAIVTEVNPEDDDEEPDAPSAEKASGKKPASKKKACAKKTDKAEAGE